MFCPLQVRATVTKQDGKVGLKFIGPKTKEEGARSGYGCFVTGAAAGGACGVTGKFEEGQQVCLCVCLFVCAHALLQIILSVHTPGKASRSIYLSLERYYYRYCIPVQHSRTALFCTHV